MDTAVNAQITDSAAPANAKEAGGSRIVITGNLYQATAQALANAAHNATAGEQQTALLAQASTVQGIITLLNADTAATGEGS
ncbi:MAG TPA: RebB family R body protein [Candidatus Kapabacteria bacterium]|nr:RebB family R body protein [Candidatus Kapabacteria bacterium]